MYTEKDKALMNRFDKVRRTIDFSNDADEVPEKPLKVEKPKLAKFKITITSNKVNSLVKTSILMAKVAKKTPGVHKVKGPIPMPNQTMCITTRRTPCGEGSKTWDKFKMVIHKRVLLITSVPEALKVVTTISLDPNLVVEVVMAT